MSPQELSNQFFLSNIDTALGRSGLPTAEIAELIRQTNARLQCDAACQKRKKLDELKDTWTSAKTKYDNLPQIINKSEEAYYTEAHGPDYYRNHILGPRYNKYIRLFAIEKRKEFSAVKKIIDTLLANYKGGSTSLDRFTQLYNDLQKKKSVLNRDIDNEYKSTITAERRVYYEMEDINSLQSYNSTLSIIYYVILAILLILYLIFGSFFRKKEYKTVGFWIYLSIVIILSIWYKSIVNFFYNLLNPHHRRHHHNL